MAINTTEIKAAICDDQKVAVFIENGMCSNTDCKLFKRYMLRGAEEKDHTIVSCMAQKRRAQIAGDEVLKQNMAMNGQKIVVTS
jgi:hypothetical protein